MTETKRGEEREREKWKRKKERRRRVDNLIIRNSFTLLEEEKKRIRH